MPIEENPDEKVRESIYLYIQSRIVDGMLPDGFSLAPYADASFPVPMADGAMDGITLYHTRPPELREGFVQDWAKAIAAVCEGGTYFDDSLVRELVAEQRVIGAVHEIQDAVFQVADSIDQGALFAYIRYLLYAETDIELVKLALVIFELFGGHSDDLKNGIRMLAACDEFTVFCCGNALRWENGNDEVFGMARRAKGWGRIHAIRLLEPATPEIRDWLFREGVRNRVMPDYSALECYLKAGVAERLDADMNHDDFAAATAIVSAALGGGPTAGLLALEHPEVEFARYVRQAARQPLDAQDRACLEAIAACARDAGWDELATQCESLVAAANGK